MLELFDTWFERHRDDQGLMIAVGVRPDEEEVPRDLALNWFQKRIKKINQKLKIEENRITIYRCMNVNSSWIKKLINGEIESFGEHWTLDKDLVPYLMGGFGGKRNTKNVILEAKLNMEDFDILSLFQASYADEYEEFEVLPTAATLIKVHNGDFSKVLGEFNIVMKF
jgi:hypothetical protein